MDPIIEKNREIQQIAKVHNCRVIGRGLRDLPGIENYYFLIFQMIKLKDLPRWIEAHILAQIIVKELECIGITRDMLDSEPCLKINTEKIYTLYLRLNKTQVKAKLLHPRVKCLQISA